MVKRIVFDKLETNATLFIAKGYIILNNVVYKDERLEEMLTKITTEKEFFELLNVINGFYAFAININKKVYVVSDTIRSIPLFWRLDGEALSISNDAYELIEKNDEIGQSEYLEMLCVGYTTGKTTLVKNIYQTEAGMCLIFENGKITCKDYVKLNGKIQNDENILVHMLENSYKNAIARLILYLDGRRAVIPLSGGLDGRFIINLLLYAGYDNILTFTYGKTNKDEVSVSEAIAKRAGVPWLYVPYIGKQMQKLYYSNEYDKLIAKGGNLSTLPVLQEWYAINYMLEQGIISQKDVVIPGHTISNLAELAPDTLMKSEDFRSQDIVGMYVKGNYLFNRDKVDAASKKIYNLYLEESNKDKVYKRQEAYEKLKVIGYRERQTKYIGNSIRTYETYGIDCIMPFWDRELVESWSKIPLSLAYKRKIYYTTIEKIFPGLTTILGAYGHESEVGKVLEEAGWKKKLKPLFKRGYLIYGALCSRYKQNMNLGQYNSFGEYMSYVLKGEYNFFSMWMERCARQTIRLIEEKGRHSDEIEKDFKENIS